MTSVRRLKPIELPHHRVFVHAAECVTKEGWKSCEIGRNITFRSEALASYFFKNRDELVYDAFLVAAAVEYCDYSAHRTEKSWGREFTVSVPVEHLEHWSSENIQKQLRNVLNILTGDSWHFDFRKRDFQVQWPEQILAELDTNFEAVLAFSNGLDSLAVSELAAQKYGDKLSLVRIGKPEEKKRQAFVAMPYKVQQNGDPKESSGRSRGFKFAILSSAAAYLSGASKVVVTESGQGSLGPALVPLSHSAIDYRNHPIFIKPMMAFVSALFEHELTFEIPQLWKTKGETLREYADIADDKEAWKVTRSCWRGARETSFNGKLRQCGICAACLLRRMSMHAAGLQECAEEYFWYDLNASSFEVAAVKNAADIPALKSHRKSATGGLAHLRDLAELRENPNELSNLQLHASRTASAMGISYEDAFDLQTAFLRKHETEWLAFLASLQPDSFLVKWANGRG